ncbi:GAF domain-containing protein [Variovorax sp. J22P240]|uniref:GAF domain-containing protein n=1 Tax=Variovorax sp. J22P240 TaxID=3053514 RepID=UPI0025760992|nr:GAF domain-containing protein [Variovorax sp. J22P240]MDL9997443.1 GAF domain-containing protein [Variovorax sp. J22P240]
MSPVRDISVFTATLRTAGPEAALAFLNAAVPHRYSAVYRLHGSTLQNVYLHDKQGELRPEFLAIVPFETSFCQFVLRDGAFLTDDSGADSRLDGHPYQGVMVSYHGVPLVGATGELIGTLCHFDVQSHSLPDGEYALLQSAALVLPPFLPSIPAQPVD